MFRSEWQAPTLSAAEKMRLQLAGTPHFFYV
jgi:hypothetical protein